MLFLIKPLFKIPHGTVSKIFVVNFLNCIYTNNFFYIFIGNDTCLTGYTGILCEKCDKSLDYGPSGSECSKCGDKILHIYSIIFTTLVTLILISNQINGVKKRINKNIIQKSLRFAFNYPINNQELLFSISKIFLNHLQITYLGM